MFCSNSLINKILFFSLLAGLLCFSACTDPTKTAENASEEEAYFFDLKGFIQNDIASLKKQNSKLDKTVKIGDKNERQLVEQPDWNNELKVFEDSDINKVAWYDKYEEQINGNSIVYLTTDSTLKTKRLQIDFNEKADKASQDVRSIIVINNTKNVLYQSSEFLTYIPKNNISIIRNQKVKTGTDETIEIRGKILP